MPLKCEDCRFWDGDVDGWCRRFPPVVTADHATLFPITQPDDWCGEWQMKRGKDE